MQEDASSSEGSRSKKKREDCHRCHSIDGKMDQLRYRIGKLQWKLCDREALLLAQDLFPIWRHAMVDSSVILPDSGRHLASKEILRLEWGSMCKVAEMELSLMYEVLYTKAIVAHSFKGWYYLTRFLLPLCTAAAALLFWLHRQHQQQGKIRGSFVGITYALLLIDFLLDLAWLLRALGSTWAYAYMQTQAPAWLRHQELLFQRVQAILLEAIETDDHDTAECYSMEDIRSKWGEKAFDLRNPEGRRIDLFPELDIHDVVAPKFGKEFEEDVLVWHIATCMVLQYIRQRQRRSDVRGPPLVLPARSEDHATAIAVMSEYMMFLVAVRRDMLPGLVLHSLFKVTRETLVDIWNEHKHTPLLRPEDNRKAPTNEEKLGLILRRMKGEGEEEGSIKIEGTEGTELLWDAVTLFRSLMLAGDTPADRVRRENAIESRVTVRRRRRVPVPELLEFIFNVWVDKLVYASVRCSRESHANQLSAGGGLTTVLWMVIQHAGPFRFRTAELRPIYFDIPRPGAPPPPKSKPPPPPKSQPPPPPPPPVLVSPAPPPMTWPWPSVPVPTPPAHSPPAPPDQDEDEDEDSDDEDTEQYNRPIEYITLY
ncbi:hypothetical protein HU200_046376 [Digitaria exilis]|uniref:DUF4220 domain-containing protein n=1 Tax=Digitaria exilis TaxID=1010633 RepID=A0A835B5S4_9POAL|nr:hypothetical protein HU200_046376 [Digitaria exilis]